MTHKAFYGAELETMEQAKQQLLELIFRYPASAAEDIMPVIYCCARLKSPESMIEKLERCGLTPDRKTALTQVYDAIGVRAVCSFTEDVYRLANWLSAQPSIEIIRKKDYIAYPKPNGYRSYHIQLKIREGTGKGFLAEIQLRTIATDFWASLEHQLKYKKELSHEKLIRSELKRCADEIASVDLSMQTIRDILREDTTYGNETEG